eukprot:1378426-Prymnesium_polylepis.2
MKIFILSSNRLVTFVKEVLAHTGQTGLVSHILRANDMQNKSARGSHIKQCPSFCNAQTTCSAFTSAHNKVRRAPGNVELQT